MLFLGDSHLLIASAISKPHLFCSVIPYVRTHLSSKLPLFDVLSLKKESHFCPVVLICFSVHHFFRQRVSESVREGEEQVTEKEFEDVEGGVRISFITSKKSSKMDK